MKYYAEIIVQGFYHVEAESQDEAKEKIESALVEQLQRQVSGLYIEVETAVKV